MDILAYIEGEIYYIFLPICPWNMFNYCNCFVKQYNVNLSKGSLWFSNVDLFEGMWWSSTCWPKNGGNSVVLLQ
jgi:hypothetical protein